ncbi:MAG TPA: bifunctional demethylmenaquinone methyltransferase/2-methoxy-6-polyprenyl-1,4-benzoquinol methylase UbiE [Thermoanaerobaculia bacterium]|nr:bifunctional demethylmenaquinone methyltransferase/2-methoxy-6-polyprenyl-1,4-benzoquinol methylase UbiE [Thermoanaerobaculia bacterium]
MPYSGPEAQKIREMFRSIAGRYDRANTVISGGVHHRWRAEAVRWSGAKEGDAVLDCATGTGDLALAFRAAVGASGRVVGTDFVPEMLAHAVEKAGKTPGLVFEAADVTALPYPDASFDIASISFGLRNVSDPRKGLAEMARVVRPGGCVLVLEFGQPRNRAFGAIYDLYRRRLLPLLGGMVTGRREAYQYLETSASRFPCGEDLVSMMRESASFSTIDYRPLSLGIAYIYRGITS